MNKKFTLLLVVLAVLAMGASSAAAAEIKATGSWQIDAQWNDNFDMKKGPTGEDNTFSIAQRMRTAFAFVANENLKAVLDTQIGTNNWGNGLYSIGAGRSAGVWTSGALAGGLGSANANNAGNGNIMLRRAYLDFKLPNTKVNFLVGFQTLSLPQAFGGGSAILDDQFAAAAAVVPINDNLALIGGYGRLYDSQAYGTQTTTTYNGHGTSTDAAFLIASITAPGFKILPFAAYANAGYQTFNTNTGATALPGFAGSNSSTNEGLRAYWGGAAFTMTAFDPFKVMADFDYGKATWNNRNTLNTTPGGRSGWLGDIAIDYTGLSMMTPELFFVYTSGESGNSSNGGKSDRMPVVGSLSGGPQNFAVGSFFLQGGDSLMSGVNGGNTPAQTLGYWALGLSLKDIKLVDKLSHTVHFIYFKGTNDKDWVKDPASSGNVYGQNLSTKDSLFEFDLNSKYQIYDELALGLELGYIAPSYDKATWATKVNAADINKDAYKACFTLMYNF